jgi:transcriptional regulator of arginine metabolism
VFRTRSLVYKAGPPKRLPDPSSVSRGRDRGSERGANSPLTGSAFLCRMRANLCIGQQVIDARLQSDNGNSSAPARRTLLVKLIREQVVGRQAELVAMLRKLGVGATQSSVSRDLRELGVAKQGDRYVLPETAVRPKSDFSTLKQFVNALQTAGSNLMVLKTTVGSAQSVAVAIDTARWPEVVGTISGDDTIFIATAGAREQRELKLRLRTIFGR